MITPWPHQLTISKQLASLLKEHGLGYLAMEERTGKSLTALLAIEQLAVKNILIVTKKKPLVGWRELLKDYPHKKVYTLVNYHMIKDVQGKFDLVVLDESHNYIGGLPKPSVMHSVVAKYTKRVPIIYISATPHAQGYGCLFHQFSLSTWTPWWIYKNYYAWHSTYGIPYTTYVGKRQIDKYDRVEDEIVAKSINHLFITKTRKELGFEQEPVDQLHYIKLEDRTKEVYNIFIDRKKRVYTFMGEHKLVADSLSKVRHSLHMLEGGVIKVKDTYLVLDNNEKVDYIKETWGDTKDLVIMHHFKAEKTKLEHHFKKATILQGTTHAEGIDLSKYETLVVYSQDYSTARHTQRRARQANLNRASPIIVHFLLVAKAISEEVYNTVSVNKRNYVDSLYEGRFL